MKIVFMEVGYQIMYGQHFHDECLLVGGRERRPGETCFSEDRRDVEAELRLLRGSGGLALVGAILIDVRSCNRKVKYDLWNLKVVLLIYSVSET